jgi:hypothetical protein
MRGLLAVLDRLSAQWLATWTLAAFMATLAIGIVLAASSGPMVERSGFKLVHLQLSGAHRLLAWCSWGRTPPQDVLAKWKETGQLEAARRNQWLDFWFPPAYGVLALLLAVALRRAHPAYPGGAGWVGGVGLGAIAALLDEAENVCLWPLLQPGASVDSFLPTAAAAFAIPKMLLLLAALATFVVGILRARA